jgi:NADPH-dependent ferric siderophore reductase
MRTYTVRAVRGGGDTRLVVDFVLHMEPGLTGPASTWASRARVGDRLVILAPRRGEFFGGIEFEPGGARRLLLAGDETAVPAVCSILEDLPDDAEGAVFLEVPETLDVLGAAGPPGVSVTWLPRNGAALGARLQAAVLAHLDASTTDPLAEPDEVEPNLWETPTFSSSGEDLEVADEQVLAAALADCGGGEDGGPVPAAREIADAHDLREGSGLEGTYAWIAGESGVVTALRRHLVRDLGMDRRQVAFMGYWRRGVAMGS